MFAFKSGTVWPSVACEIVSSVLSFSCLGRHITYLMLSITILKGLELSLLGQVKMMSPICSLHSAAVRTLWNQQLILSDTRATPLHIPFVWINGLMHNLIKKNVHCFVLCLNSNECRHSGRVEREREKQGERERETGREGDADTSVIILTGPPMLEEV